MVCRERIAGPRGTVNSVERSPLLSIVTPVYNGIRHIQACLDNVHAQNESAVEHLIVDGGSTDGTIEVVRDRANHDSRVRLLLGPDRGQSNALNKGIIAAAAPVIGCLNVDDHYLPGTLALAIAAFRDTPEPSFLWGACEVRNHADGTSWVQQPGRLVAWRMALGWDFEPHPVNPASYFYHRSLHFLAGFYDEEEHYAMDLDFLMRAAPYCRRVIAVDEVLGVFEFAPGTKTFEDMKSGEGQPRAIRVRRRIEKNLPIMDRARMFGVRQTQRLVIAYQHRILRKRG